jgi:hypothetical protein
MNWTKILETEIPKPCDSRPFVCDGFPHESNVMIIGENPGTPTAEDWWTYWNRKKGFQYDDFLSDYLSNKKIAGVRNRFKYIRSWGVKCVETNVYRNEKQGGAGKTRVDNFEVLRLLVSNNSRLRLIIIHGEKALNAVGLAYSEQPLKVKAKERRKTTDTLGPIPKDISLYATPHFIKFSTKDIRKIFNKCGIGEDS